jgi:hypothetical protein
MSQTNETQKWISWIRKSPKWTGGAIALITTVISFIILFKDNFYFAATITVSVALLAILSLCVYVAFGKTPPLIEGGEGVYRFRKERRGLALIGIVLVFLLVGYAITSSSGRLFMQAAFLETPTPTPVTFNGFFYPVRVQAKDTEEMIPKSEVTIEIIGQAPLTETTDSKGFARIPIPTSYAGQPGRLIVEANGYKLYRREIDIQENLLPNVIQRERE